MHTQANLTNFDALYELENFYDKFTPAQVKSEEAFAWFSGMPHPLFNSVMHLQTNKNVAGKVDELCTQCPHDTPISFWVHNQNDSSALKEALLERKFEHIITCPLMIWSVKPVGTPNYEIKLADAATFYKLLAITFHFDEIVVDGLAKMLANAEAENYLLYVDGIPVGTGTIIANGTTGGIFNVTTLAEYQQRGYGRAMVQFLQNRAVKIDLKNLILLSSPVAEKLYTNLEFAKCFDIELFAR